MPKKKELAFSIEFRELPLVEAAKALAEDVKVERILRGGQGQQRVPLVTEKQFRIGEKSMARAQRDSIGAFNSRIERGELITKEQLVERLGGNRRWLSAALKAGRVFSVPAPSGIDYFPSFFADASYERGALGRVAKVLVDLPRPSRYHFFTSKSTMLGKTPLQALAEGQVKNVLNCAVGFAER
jgi:hypothetical protein